MSETIKCYDLRCGMVFDMPEGMESPQLCKQHGLWKIVREGTYLHDEKLGRIQIDNHRKNKWYAKPVDSREKPVLLCFDLDMDRNQWNFRMP